MALVVVDVLLLLIASPLEPIPLLDIEVGDEDDTSGVEMRRSFTFTSLLAILRGSPPALLLPDGSPPSLLFEFPILG